MINTVNPNGSATVTYTTAEVDSGRPATFRVRAFRGTGTDPAYSAYTNTVSATPIAPTAAPTGPSGLSASIGTAGTINLVWTDNATVEDGFFIEESTDGGTTFTDIDGVGPNVTAYAASGLAPLTSYTFRIRATNAFGDSTESNAVVAVTSSAEAIVAPSNLVAVANVSGQVVLTWTDNSNNEASFYIEDSTDGGFEFDSAGTAPANATGLTIGSLTAGGSYAFRIYAISTTGDQSGFSNVATATPATPVSPPTVPTSLSTISVSATEVDVSWVDNSTSEDGFSIEQSIDGGSTFTPIDSVGPNITTYASQDLSAATNYVFRVQAFNAAGNSNYTNAAGVTTPTGTIPAAPSGLMAAAASGTQVDLTWLDNSADESGFAIEQSTDGTNFTAITTTDPDATTFAVQGLNPSTPYYFRIRATGTGGSSVYTSIVSATTTNVPLAITGVPITGVAGTSVGGVLAMFTDSRAGDTPSAFSATIDWGVDPIAAGTVTAANGVFSVSGNYSYSVGGNYSLTITITRNDGETTNSVSYATITDPTPTTPANPVASASNDGISVSWDGVSGATSYLILRSATGQTGSFLQIGATSDGVTMQYFDAISQAHATYYYEVQSKNTAGTSAPSAVVSATMADQAPVAVDDPSADVLAVPYSTPHDRPLEINLLANDTDPDADPLHIDPASLHATQNGGSLAIASDGNIIYTPRAGYVGADSFIYAATDGTIDSNSANVLINVTETPPEATSHQYGLAENGTLTVALNSVIPAPLSGGSADAEADILTFSIVGGGTPDGNGFVPTPHGKANVNADGSFTYVPNDGFIGIDNFSYKASDGLQSSNTATATITVTATQPLAQNDHYEIRLTSLGTLGTSYVGTLASSVATNDRYGTNPTFNLINNNPAGGDTFSFLTDGSFTYRATQAGTDTFQYTVTSGGQTSPVATGVINVSSPSPAAIHSEPSWYAPPSTFVLTPSVGHGHSVVINPNLPAYAGDLQGGSFALTATNGAQGTVTASGSLLTYTAIDPSTGSGSFIGWDYFTFQVTGLSGTTSAAENVAVNVTDVLPQASGPNAHLATFSNVPIQVDASHGLIASSMVSDSDGDAETIVNPTGVHAQHGTLTLNADGSFTYDPNGYVGRDWFTYQLNDGVTQSKYGSTTVPITGGDLNTVFIDDRSAQIDLVMQNETPAQRISSGGVVPLGSAYQSSGNPMVSTPTNIQDLVPLTLRIPTGLPTGTTITLQYARSGSGDVKVYTSDGALILSNATPTKTWILGQDSLSTTTIFEVNGLATSGEDADLTFTANVVPASGQPILTPLANGGGTTRPAETAPAATQKATVENGLMNVYRTHVDTLDDVTVLQAKWGTDGVGLRSQKTPTTGNFAKLELNITGDANPNNHTYFLTRTSPDIQVFSTSNGGGPLFSDNKALRASVPFNTGRKDSLYVAWVPTGGDNAKKEAFLTFEVDDQTNNTMETVGKVRYFPFSSEVVLIAGHTESSESAGDYQGLPLTLPAIDYAQKDSGAHKLGELLYQQGYDVAMFSEDPGNTAKHVDTFWEKECGKGLDQAEKAITAAASRNVHSFMLFGYSHGGGTLHDLSHWMATQADKHLLNYILPLTVYVDAIQNAHQENGKKPNAEKELPEDTQSHLCFFQPNGTGVVGHIEPHGAATKGPNDITTSFPEDGDADQDLTDHSNIDRDRQKDKNHNRPLPYPIVKTVIDAANAKLRR